jgi:hypothetical protein
VTSASGEPGGPGLTIIAQQCPRDVVATPFEDRAGRGQHPATGRLRLRPFLADAVRPVYHRARGGGRQSAARVATAAAAVRAAWERA